MVILFVSRNVKASEEADLFSVCVSELVLESRDFELFGSMNPDGCRTPGLLESMGINVHPIVSSALYFYECKYNHSFSVPICD